MEHKFKASILRRLRRREGEQAAAGKWKRRGLLLAGLLVVLWFMRVWIVLFILQIGQFVFTPILPDVDDVDALFASQSTIIYDREGSELYTIHGDENRFEIPFEKMPQTVKDATIAAEDDKFYSHPGFDVDGITRAVLGELGVGHFIGGGSTITQQFVKNAYLSPERTYWRKLQELMLALKLENHFTKDEILEMYLNRIPYGSNAYGIQAGAQTFFNKNAEDLTLAESVVLAALPQAPSRYSPYGQNRDLLMGSCSKTEIVEDTEDAEAEPTELAVPCESIDDPDYTIGRKDYVLQRMLALDFISQAEFDAAWEESNNLKFESYRESIRAPHFVFYVRDILEEEFGKDVVERGGLRVFTTLDPELQSKAEEVIAAQFPATENEDGSVDWGANRFDATNGSLLAIDNETGQIIAMVGSRDYFEELDDAGIGNDGATNLTTRPRQPGSSFKPIAYATGLKRGYTPASVFWDVETNFGKGTDEYTPKNFDGSFLGPLSMRRALDYSRNIPAVKMAILVGELAIAQTAHDLGITSVKMDERYGPTIALGAAEVPMIEMVHAYSVFANGGELVEFTPILKITDSRGNLIEEFEEAQKTEVLDSGVAYLMANILSDASARPESWNYFLNLDRPNGAKTGTANKKISEEVILPGDVWTIGFTPQITAAAWMGNNDGSPMNVSGTGLASASPIWKAFMDYAHTDLPVKNFKIPEGIVQRSVSRITGKLASATTPVDQIVVETFLDTDAPIEVDDAFVEVAIDIVSNKLPSSLTPESAIELRKFVNLHSERPYDPEWEKPVREWIEQNYGEDTELELPPTEVDDVHTTETAKHKPTVTIVSPISGSTVQKSSVGVWVDTEAEHEVEKVEYYRDGELVATATADPWKGVIPISKRLADGKKVMITAKIFDKLYYTATSTVEVTVGEDTQIPTVRISSPDAAEQVARGTTLLVRADAYDAGGDIEKVEFYLDGSRISEMTYPPYELPIVIDSSLRIGEHTLRVEATDMTGRSVSESVDFEVVEGSGVVEDFAIVFPVDGATVSAAKTSIEVIAQINQAKFVPAEVDFIARNLATGDRKIFAEVENPGSQSFTVTWRDLTAGEYEIYFKARDADGKTIISGRNTIEIK
ncbi:MAG: transglycosylase domain-containing protein [Candidatus Peribacteraceae bacterium]|nr:transglycosylase domain-containing protein [Candidatus Peribacteraceae bacterium]